MATKREILNQALEEVGVASYNYDVSPEELQAGLARLNRIAAQWDGIGIRVGYNLGGDIDSESGIPDTAENCFALNLAVQWGPSFGKVISLDTKVAAKQAWTALYTARRVLPQVPYPPQLPVGRGSRRGVLEPQYFPETSEVPGLDDGATEY